MNHRGVTSVSHAFAIGFVALIGSGVLPVASWLSHPLREWESPRHVDAIVILGGGVDDDETPNAGTLYRLFHGLRLFKQGYAPVIILTGGNPANPSVPESEVMAKVAMEQFGIPSSFLVIEREAARTVTQAQATAQIARERGIRSILLITSGLHSYRAARVFRKTGLQVVLPAGTKRQVARTQWGIAIKIKPYDILLRIGALGAVLYEYGAIGLYWWRGWI